jgi:hypothetical protein
MKKKGSIILIIVVVVLALLSVIIRIGGWYANLINNISAGLSQPNLCYLSSGFIFYDMDYSGYYGDTLAKNTCFSLYAQSKKDISACEKIEIFDNNKSETEDQYARCILKTQLSISPLTRHNCDQIFSRITNTGSSYELATCAKEVVKRTKDTSLCDVYFTRYDSGWTTCTSAGYYE